MTPVDSIRSTLRLARDVVRAQADQIAELKATRDKYHDALTAISQLQQVTFNQSPELHMALEIARKALSE